MTRTFIDDDNYSNYLGAILPAILINKKISKRKDAEQRQKLAQIEQEGARQRMEFAKNFEERRKAEKDLKDAELKEAKAVADKNLADTGNVPQSKPSNIKKIALIGGGVLVVGIVLYIALRKK